MYATCKGSWDAATDLALALEALVALNKGIESGWGWDDLEIPRLLTECLGTRPQLFQEFLEELIGYGLLSGDIKSSGQALHSYEQYESMWDTWQVSPDELTHDAALDCFENWSLSSLMERWKTFNWDNAQDLVMLLLRIVLCHSRLKPQTV
jgi:hypothetical protein